MKPRDPAQTAVRSAASLVARSAVSTVYSLFLAQVASHPDRPALQFGSARLSYAQLDARVRRLAALLERRGVGNGGRIAVLSENRPEYVEVLLAAARLGAVVACQNWRLTATELTGCLDLAEPSLIFVSERHRSTLAAAGRQADVIVFGNDYEDEVQQVSPDAAPRDVDPESALLILYTSGTTGLPKGAVLSHRAQVVRNLVTRAEFSIAAEDTFAAWTPLYHMGGVDNTLGTLMAGGKVVIVDGFDVDALAGLVASEPLGWLLLMPGMVGRFAALLRERNVTAQGVKVCGVMADLVSPHEIADVTRLLGAPYANTFGSTETGCPPCSSSLLAVGVVPTRLSKQQSPFCEVRLVDSEDRDVPPGAPGELAMRGPTLFSGYWRNPEVTAHDFRGGWFHMGDVFVRNADGTLDFVDRVKYLIKTGGENVYPAEIERVLLAEARVADAAVVRRKDERWGEVPVAFVARRDDSLTAEDLLQRCREQLAGYKRPKEIHFIPMEAMPRSASGKVQRHELEKRLRQDGD